MLKPQKQFRQFLLYTWKIYSGKKILHINDNVNAFLLKKHTIDTFILNCIIKAKPGLPTLFANPVLKLFVSSQKEKKKYTLKFQ